MVNESFAGKSQTKNSEKFRVTFYELTMDPQHQVSLSLKTNLGSLEVEEFSFAVLFVENFHVPLFPRKCP